MPPPVVQSASVEPEVVSRGVGDIEPARPEPVAAEPPTSDAAAEPSVPELATPESSAPELATTEPSAADLATPELADILGEVASLAAPLGRTTAPAPTRVKPHRNGHIGPMVAPLAVAGEAAGARR